MLYMKICVEKKLVKTIFRSRGSACHCMFQSVVKRCSYLSSVITNIEQVPKVYPSLISVFTLHQRRKISSSLS